MTRRDLSGVVRARREQERAERRRQRELEAAAKARAKADAQAEVDAYENQIARLNSIHRECEPAIDWQASARLPEPSPPPPDTTASDRARRALEAYRPGWLARLLGYGGTRRRLEDRLAAALGGEQLAAAKARDVLARAQESWRAAVATAQAVLEGAPETLAEVVDATGGLVELGELGFAPVVAFVERGVARVALTAPEGSIIPREEKRLGARGQVLTKELSATRIAELYQDVVCGAALRAARELHALLPLDVVIVDVTGTVLDAATGHDAQAVLLSVACPRAELGGVNWERVDASELVLRLPHAMDVKRGRGFAPITPL